MSTRKLSTLIIAAAVMLAATVYLYSGEEKVARDFVPGSLLIQGLDPAAIHTIQIKSGPVTVSLTRAASGDNFLVASKNNYPADTQRVNELLIAALEIRCAAKVTTSAANHADLGVSEDAEGVIIARFLDKDGKELMGLIRGKNIEGGNGHYVRRAGDDAVYSTQTWANINATEQQYLDTQLTKVDAAKIARVDVDTPSGSYVITQEAENDIVLQAIPEGKRPKGKTYETVFRAGSALRFNEVKPAAEVDVAFDNTFTMQLQSGLTYTIKSAKKDGKSWLALSAEAPPMERNISIAVDESKEELEKKEEKIKAAETAKKFNERHAPWVYEVSTWYADNMAKPLADLVEDASAPGDAPAPAMGPGAGALGPSFPALENAGIAPSDVITLDGSNPVVDLTEEPASNQNIAEPQPVTPETPAAPDQPAAPNPHDGHDHQ